MLGVLETVSTGDFLILLLIVLAILALLLFITRR